MPSIDTRVEVAIGLVYPPGDLHSHLRDALRDLGATIVYEAETANFDRSALERAGAQVVIVNLDPDIDEQDDAIDDLLVDDRLKVVFNDGEVTSKLSGYDLARWSRHLAAKIVGDAELLPPRPIGAEAVPLRSMPQHALTSASMPKSLDAPAVSDESMRDATDAIADALASFDMHTTKLEAKNATVAPPVPATDLDALLGDFGLAPAVAPVTAPSPASNPFADLGLELDIGNSALDTLSAPASDAQVVDASQTPTVELVFDLPLTSEVDGLGDQPAEAANPFEQIDFTIDAPITSAEPASAPQSDLMAFADLDFDAPQPPRAQEDVLGLDDFLAQNAETAPAKPVAQASVRKPDSPTPRPSFESLSLRPEDAPIDPPPVKTEAPAFHFDLDHLSLEPSEEELRAAGNGDPFADRGMTYESVLDESRPAQKIVQPAPPAAVVPPAPSPKTSAVSADDPFDFSFDLPELTADDLGPPLAAASAPDAMTADDDVDEFAFMREFEMGAAAPDTATASDGPIERVWVLGASIGGPDAVREFLAAVPLSVGATFVLAQHMGADFVDLMVTQLQKATPMPVGIATAGSRVGHGQVLVVPIAERMLLDPSGDVRVVALDEVSSYSPSIDRVLIDIADRFGAAAGAIIFSGMAHDAIEGAKHMAAKGGQIWVQDPSTCVVSSMIDGAMEAGIVGFIGTPVALAAEFARRYGKA